ncbi:MAG TPA: hypothetical protein VI874_00930 [Candidatus Norongarragalinales archaeon]|nr:hypothetical protein [Candidatus Norongarragalinales archaeon]
MVINTFAKKPLIERRRPSFPLGPIHPLREEVERRPELSVRKIDPVDQVALQKEEREAALQRGSLTDIVGEDQMAEAYEKRRQIERFYVVRRQRLTALAPRLVNAVLTARQLSALLTRKRQSKLVQWVENRAISDTLPLQPKGVDRNVSILGRRVVLKSSAWKWIQAVGRARTNLVRQVA